MIRSVKIVCSSNHHVSWGNWSCFVIPISMNLDITMLLESSILRSKKLDLMENPSECWHNNESYQSQPWEWCKPHTTKQKPPEKHSINMLPRCHPQISPGHRCTWALHALSSLRSGFVPRRQLLIENIYLSETQRLMEKGMLHLRLMLNNII